MSVQRIHEDPRVTKPYTEEQWQAIEQLGREIDERAPRRRRPPDDGWRADLCLDRRHGRRGMEHGRPGRHEAHCLPASCSSVCKNRFAPGGLLHFGQARWYPGESLPRWALGCYWRADGVPVWENPDLIADEAHDYGHSPADAHRFIATLAERWASIPILASPAYEDVWLLPLARAAAAGQCRSPRQQSRRP